MATDDLTLKSEVRSITDYDTTIIGDGDLDAVIAVAKREIAAKVGIPDLDFYSGLSEERALFWLTCLFAKIKKGEVEGMEMSIGDVEKKPLRVDGKDDRASAVVWKAEFSHHFNSLLSQNGGAYASRSIARNNRIYGDE